MSDKQPPAKAIPVDETGRARMFPSAEEDRRRVGLDADTPQTRSSAYKLGFADLDFIMRDELRGERLQLEFLKPDILQRDRGITSTVVVFGSTRIPAPDHCAAMLERAELQATQFPDDDRVQQRLRVVRSLVAKSRFYEEARRLGRLISGQPCDQEELVQCTLPHGPYRTVIVTGGGPGIMEAANRGAADLGAENVGLNIVLPFEQHPNEYITPYLCFNFHYFSMRKLHFLMRAVALCVFPGGFGTLDEMFEVLTLIQTQKVAPLPVLLFGKEFWDKVVNFQALVDEGTIAPADLDIFKFVETADEAWVYLEPVLKAAALRGATRRR